MKKILFILLALLVFAVPGWAGSGPEQMVKISEARRVAENWLDLTIQKKGSWGGAEVAYIENIQRFRQHGRSIGFFCKVQPRGFIIVTLRKEFSPIKAYSATSDLDPDADTGMADLIKGKMAKKINVIEKRLGALDKISSQSLRNMLKTNHRTNWDVLTGDRIAVKPVDSADSAGSSPRTKGLYQEGDFLLTSNWTQVWPYNKFTPLGTDIFPYIYACPAQPNHYHTRVGCVATAAAQVMRYWNWPPYRMYIHTGGITFGDPFDWLHMLDICENSSPQENIDAVARLCHEVGTAVDMDYGCDASSADSSDLLDVFSGSFQYSGYIQETLYDMQVANPPAHWFEKMKTQINQNRPILYSMSGDPGHEVVVDGWEEYLDFTPSMKEFHINYGHGNDQTAWYTLDESSIPEEAADGMITNIYPAASLLGTVNRTYTKNDGFIPYYYFDRNTEGENAVFESGLNLQFLPGVKLTNTSTSSGAIRIVGRPFTENTTTLFSIGNKMDNNTIVTNGVKIFNGEIEIYKNGSMKIY